MMSIVSIPDDESIRRYLQKRYGKVSDIKCIRLGAGVHGEGYRVSFRSNAFKGEMNLVLKTLSPQNFGHDYMADRASVNLLAKDSYSKLPGHVRCVDVMAYNEKDLYSVKGSKEFYVLMQEAKGHEYFGDLKDILSRGDLNERDIKRAKALADYLINIHSTKYKGDNAKSLYRRKIRDTVGHGECLMGVLDTYEDWPFIKRKDMVEIVSKSISHWDRLKDNMDRLCQVHGDFHPGNIWFDEDDNIVLLDRSRGIWGEPADDLFCLLVNYLFYSILHTGDFSGPFRELFELVHSRYIGMTWDNNINLAGPLFLAFRIPVLTNPHFYPHVDDTTRTKLIGFAKNVLDDQEFSIDRIRDYLKL